MDYLNDIKIGGISLTSMVLLLGVLIFSASSSISTSNQQLLEQVAKEIKEKKALLNNLKAKEECADATLFEPFLGQIAMVGFNFAPKGWMQCNGQLLLISEYQALFSLLGTTYGGDGRTTFALPDFRGRAVLHKGQGSGLNQNWRLGEERGVERGSPRTSKTSVAKDTTGQNSAFAVTNIPDAINHMQPSLGSNYIIAVTGIFPSRS